MQENLRLFVAVPLPPVVVHYLDAARQAYEGPTIKMMPLQNLHLTLYFIGNVAAQEEAVIREELSRIAEKYTPFTLQLEQLEPGPKPRAPRLIWARFKQAPQFTQLCRDITYKLSPTPPKLEKFIPHVTVCRFKKDGPIPLHLPLIAPAEEILFAVTSLALWKSTLGSPHPVYQILEEYPLAGLDTTEED